MNSNDSTFYVIKILGYNVLKNWNFFNHIYRLPIPSKIEKLHLLQFVQEKNEIIIHSNFIFFIRISFVVVFILFSPVLLWNWRPRWCVSGAFRWHGGRLLLPIFVSFLVVDARFQHLVQLLLQTLRVLLLDVLFVVVSPVRHAVGFVIIMVVLIMSLIIIL